MSGQPGDGSEAPGSPPGSPPRRDSRRSFLIESCDVRGQLVHLDDTWRDALARTDYPPPVREVLGETFVAALLLAGTLKFEGRMTLQVRGAGPVHLLVVQVNREGEVRGLARWTALPEPAADPSSAEGNRLATLFGDEARLVITIEAKAQAEPYQSVVALEGGHLGEALVRYFRDSVQLDTELFLAVGEAAAAGMLLQALPASEVAEPDADGRPDGWRRAAALGGTLTPADLLERDAEGLLHALFHEERVRVFEPTAVRFCCSCSRERTDGMLQGLGEGEVRSILEEQGRVEITCEFCDACYRYDAVDVEALFRGAGGVESAAEATRH